MDSIKLAQAIAEMLEGKECHEQIMVLEISARLLFKRFHVKLTLEAV